MTFFVARYEENAADFSPMHYSRATKNVAEQNRAEGAARLRFFVDRGASVPKRKQVCYVQLRCITSFVLSSLTIKTFYNKPNCHYHFL